MAKHTGKHVGVANPQLAAAMRGLRSSGAAGIHADKRTRRERTRAAARRAAVAREEA
jgi:hypothetical protein